MPVTPSYPGIYIQELPSSTHTITAAPTSVTVFVGYVHPFKTAQLNFGKALEIFSFSDYERLFGGFYQSGLIDANLPFAVNEFFLNGGSDAIVVGLQPQHYYDTNKNKVGDVAQASLAFSQAGNKGIQFTALEPVDSVSLNVAISPVPSGSSAPIADIIITYGGRTETYRKVALDSASPNFIETMIGTASNPVSSLVTVAKPAGAGGNYPAAFTKEQKNLPAPSNIPSGANVFNAPDFMDVFKADSSLDKVSIFNLLLIPGIVDNGILSEALAFCERKRAFFIMDPPSADAADPGNNWVGDFLGTGNGDSGGKIAPLSANGALYFPYLKSANPVTGSAKNPDGTLFTLPPSGFVAGVFARTDVNRGVWKAPAGLETTILDTTGVVASGVMTDQRQGVLNNFGVNCLRTFPGTGTVVFGARTLVSNNGAYLQWKYVPVRRMALFLEQTLYRNLGWVVFEPNDEPLWVAIRTSLENFMLSLFHQGAFQGSKPSQAFQVKCDADTTTQTDIDQGIVNILVGFAPLKPAEFVIIKIAQLAGQNPA